MSNDRPTVSIGMPVFNGANYIEEAIQSILNQTYSDFELIISDNASTDATGEICQAYVKQDSRIHYCLNEKNLGAAKNFNRVFKLARGKYFKWAAHDDVIAPDFLEKCIAVLERDSSLVLSYPKARIIDENGKPLQDYDLQLKTNSPNPSKRFGELLRGHECFEIFGLTPVSALKLTPLIGNYGHGDGVLLARLALQGRFHEIPEYLLFPRRHPQSSYIIELYAQEWLKLDPKVVVINLGTNDTKPDWLALNLGRIIVMSLRAGIQPILLLEPNSLENKTNFLLSQHQVMRVVGKSRGVPVIDMHCYLRDKYDEGFLWWDFVHLADFGQDLFAEKLYNELEQILL